MALKLAALLIVLAVGAPPLAGTASAALTASNLAGDYTSGTLRLSAVQSDGSTPISALVPGDAVASTITVTNEGSLELRYAVTGQATTGDALSSELALTIWDEAVEQDAGTACASQPPASILYGPTVLGDDAVHSLLGDLAQGAQPGDRTLAPGARETLCFQTVLPLSMDNANQVASTPAFDFWAEQTHNN